MLSGMVTYPELPLPYKRTLDGRADWGFLKPVYTGDTLTSVTRFISFEEHKGKSGPLLLLNFEAIHRNQENEIVARSKNTLINLP